MNAFIPTQFALFLLLLVEIKCEDDEFVLSPGELANMILKQAEEYDDFPGWQVSTKDPNYLASSELTTELSDDEARLRSRKVWSRWGKWSECSVTCGSGVRSRHRVCLEGRCAPGERECQSRPCARGPCDAAARAPLGEYSHDLD